MMEPKEILALVIAIVKPGSQGDLELSTSFYDMGRAESEITVNPVPKAPDTFSALMRDSELICQRRSQESSKEGKEEERW
eukprot:1691270-Amphidinium_carterae.2